MPPITVNIAFQALSLAVLGAYCAMLHLYGAQAAECLRDSVGLRAPENGENKRRQDSFTAVALTIGALSAGLAAVKVLAAGLAAGTGTRGSWQWRVADVAGTAGLDGLPQWLPAVATVAVAVAVAVIVAAETAVVAAAGRLTLSRTFTGELLREKRNSLAAVALVAAPLVAMWTGVNPERDRIIVYIIVAVTIICAAMFVIRTFAAFVRQKVSVLVWFLYLCTVEIFPVYALVLTATNNV